MGIQNFLNNEKFGRKNSKRVKQFVKNHPQKRLKFDGVQVLLSYLPFQDSLRLFQTSKKLFWQQGLTLNEPWKLYKKPLNQPLFFKLK